MLGGEENLKIINKELENQMNVLFYTFPDSRFNLLL